MKIRYRSAAPMLAILLSAASASADDERWYFAGNLGAGDLAATTLSYTAGETAVASVDFDVSFAGGATIGYRLTDRFSVEGDIKYRRNEFGAVDLGDLGSFSGGDFASLGIGVNLLYRFAITDDGRFSGYVGPGFLYFQEIDIDFDNASQQEVSFESDDSGLQFKLGGQYALSERWFVGAEATYLAGGSVTMELPSDNSQTLSADYDHWTVSFNGGFRF